MRALKKNTIRKTKATADAAAFVLYKAVLTVKLMLTLVFNGTRSTGKMIGISKIYIKYISLQFYIYLLK